MLVGEPRKILSMRAIVPILCKVLRARGEVVALAVPENQACLLFCLSFFHLIFPLSNQLIVVAVVLFCEQVIIGRSVVGARQIFDSVIPPVVLRESKSTP